MHPLLAPFAADRLQLVQRARAMGAQQVDACFAVGIARDFPHPKKDSPAAGRLAWVGSWTSVR